MLKITDHRFWNGIIQDQDEKNKKPQEKPKDPPKPVELDAFGLPQEEPKKPDQPNKPIEYDAFGVPIPQEAPAAGEQKVDTVKPKEPQAPASQPTIPKAENEKEETWRSLLGGFRKLRGFVAKTDNDIFGAAQGADIVKFPVIPEFSDSIEHTVRLQSPESPFRFYADAIARLDTTADFTGSNKLNGGVGAFFDATFQSALRIEPLDDVPFAGSLFAGLPSGELRLRNAGVEAIRDPQGDFNFDYSGTAIYTLADLQFRIPILAHLIEGAGSRPTDHYISNTFFNPTVSLSAYGQRNYRFPDYNPFFDPAESAYGFIGYFRDPSDKQLANFAMQWGVENEPAGHVWDKAKVFRAAWFLPNQSDNNDSSATNLFDNSKMFTLAYEEKRFTDFHENTFDIEGSSKGASAVLQLAIPPGLQGGLMGALGGTTITAGLGYKWYKAEGDGPNGNFTERDSVMTAQLGLERSFGNLKVKLFGERDMRSTYENDQVKFEPGINVGLSFGFKIT